MAFVIVGASLGLTGQHQKNRLTAVQRLNLTLLIHAQHQRMMRWVQVQADEISQFVDHRRSLDS